MSEFLHVHSFLQDNPVHFFLFAIGWSQCYFPYVVSQSTQIRDVTIWQNSTDEPQRSVPCRLKLSNIEKSNHDLTVNAATSHRLSNIVIRIMPN